MQVSVLSSEHSNHAVFLLGIISNINVLKIDTNYVTKSLKITPHLIIAEKDRVISSPLLMF